VPLEWHTVVVQQAKLTAWEPNIHIRKMSLDQLYLKYWSQKISCLAKIKFLLIFVLYGCHSSVML